MKTHKNFELGTLVTSGRISKDMKEDPKFERETYKFFEMFRNHNWGDLSQVDSEMNDSAVERPGTDRILAAYNTSKGRIYIVTAYDQTTTEIMYADER